MSSSKADPQLSRHIDDLYPTLDQVIAASDLAEALVAHPGWDVLLALLGAEIETIDTRLDSGRPLEHVEYASAHGRRGGLKAPEGAVQALKQRAESRVAEQRRKHEGAAEPALERG